MRTRTGIAVLFSAACASVSSAQPSIYRVATEESRLTVHVGRSGLFKVLGHDHVIRVSSFTGTIEWDGSEPESARFALEVDAASLAVADDGLSEDDRANVQTRMETEALALPQHTAIAFTSTRVEIEKMESAEYRLKLIGELTLRGIRNELVVPLTLTLDGERLIARGKLELEAKQWGVPQISALGGSVKTKEELGMEFEIVAVR